MQNALGFWALQTVGVDVAHHVVTAFPFPALGVLVVDVVLMGFQLGDLLVGDGKPLRLFRFGQSDPELPPCAELVVLGENELHVFAGIAGGKGADVGGMVGHGETSLKDGKGVSRCPDG